MYRMYSTDKMVLLFLSMSQDVVLVQSEPLRYGARGQCQRRPARHVFHATLSAHGSDGRFPLLPGVHQVGSSRKQLGYTPSAGVDNSTSKISGMWGFFLSSAGI